MYITIGPCESLIFQLTFLFTHCNAAHVVNGPWCRLSISTPRLGRPRILQSVSGATHRVVLGVRGGGDTISYREVF